MRISLKDTQIAGYWATARKNTLDDCVSELHHFMTSLESLYPGGHWRIMREAPQRLGANVENAIPGLTDLLLGQLEGAKTLDADALFGYYFNLEYLGPLPIIVQGCVGIQTDNKNFKNFVLIKFWQDPEVPESSQGEPTLESGHQLLETIIRCWSPHLCDMDNNHSVSCCTEERSVYTISRMENLFQRTSSMRTNQRLRKAPVSGDTS